MRTAVAGAFWFLCVVMTIAAYEDPVGYAGSAIALGAMALVFNLAAARILRSYPFPIAVLAVIGVSVVNVMLNLHYGRYFAELNILGRAAFSLVVALANALAVVRIIDWLMNRFADPAMRKTGGIDVSGF
ncbi:MAG TPA: hypothetical protein VMT99_00580 [Candidatus Paceibacterota bacterium]|nr:hypothetical protein [Candidatus Paceibacterota bacterium]